MEQQPQPFSSATTTSPSSSQRRELQGPRPAPLKVRKDSHKIRKPPPPQPGGGGGGGGPVQQVRQPVIIYTVSPKVVHAEPGEFMSVVQRLTGARGTTASSSSLPVPPPTGTTTTTELHHHQIQMTSSSLPFPFPFLGGHHVHAPPPSSSAQLLPPAAPHLPFQLQQQAPGGAAPPQHDHLMIHQLSPAARLSAIEQAAAASARSSGGTATADVGLGGGLLPPFPSILSPGSLPAIPPSFFSPPASAGNSYPPGISLFGGLISPAFLGNETTGGGSMSMSIAAIAGASHQSVMSSPSTVTPSPSAGAYYWDLFNNQQH
ncbi:protein MKS1-like [Miscanthus floridulus]|uniref:protein MKS1-like n=1 Tax=Miscanthus floridulus TaxID=154761 RepID=UPI00345B2214